MEQPANDSKLPLKKYEELERDEHKIKATVWISADLLHTCVTQRDKIQPL